MKALYFEQHGELDVIQYGDVPEPEMGEMLYGPNWQAVVETHRREQENWEIMLTAAVVITGLGVVSLGLSILVAIIHLIAKLFKKRKRKRNQADTPDTIPDKMKESSRTEAAIKDVEQDDQSLETDSISQRQKLDDSRPQPSTRSKVSVDIPEEKNELDIPDLASYHRVYPSCEEVAHEEPALSHVDPSVQNLMSDEPEESLPGTDQPILNTSQKTPESQTAVSSTSIDLSIEKSENQQEMGDGKPFVTCPCPV